MRIASFARAGAFTSILIPAVLWMPGCSGQADKSTKTAEINAADAKQTAETSKATEEYYKKQAKGGAARK